MAISQEQSTAALKVIEDALIEIEKDIAELKAGSQVGAPMSQETYDRIVALGTRAKAAGEIFTGTSEPPTGEV